MGLIKKDALAAALKYISLRPRSVVELTRRLKEKGFTPPEIGEAVDRLKEAGYLDDEKYAHLLVVSRVRNKNWGPSKIAFDLAAKGISEEVITKALGRMDSQQETAIAGKALIKWMKRNRLAAPLDKEWCAKAFRFLKGRGFGASAISGALKGNKGRYGEES